MQLLTLSVVLCLGAVVMSEDNVDKEKVGRFCPGMRQKCGNFDTCCPMTIGWGCCHLRNAQCCLDGKHCCPHGYRCGIFTKKCYRVDREIPKVEPMIEKVVNTTMVDAKDTQQVSNPNVGLVCPNHSQCPSPGAACCRAPSGSYNCCSYPNNVCCSDGLHCCAHGTVCDSLRHLCIPYPSAAGNSEPLTELKTPQQTHDENPENLKYP